MKGKMRVERIRKAIVFEKIVDKVLFYAGVDSAEVIKDLGLTHPNDFILRGFWRWRAGSPPRRYEALRKQVERIRAFSKAIISGGIHLMQLWRDEWDDYLFRWVRYPKTWEMALDPGKWGFGISKEFYNCRYLKRQGMFRPPCSSFDPVTAVAYAPDLSNPDYQQLLFHMGLRQVVSGCNAIWIDAWLWTVSDMARLAKDPRHPAVRDLVNGFNRVSEMLRKAGALVSSWYSRVPFKQRLDIVTIWAATPDEIRKGKISRERVEREIQGVREAVGEVPVVAIIDWGGWNPPMYTFSQELTPEEQREFLEYAYDFFKAYPEVTFALPVMGGTMGKIGAGPRVKSFGRFDVYCSFAPEFRTYDTIKKLLTEG